MKQFIITFLFLCAFSVHLSAQDTDPCFVLSCVLDQVDEAVVQGNYDDALTWLENVKNNPDMRNCDKMKNGVLDFKINDVKKKIAERIPSYKQCPDGNHPHLIDLGLPSGTKWACCNVDAKTPEDYGGYYAWGETEEKEVYNDVTYRYSTGEDTDGDGMYDTNEQNQNLGSNICGTQYDVAHVKWGDSWQLPTKDQIIELKDKCTHEWTTMNGVKGRKFIGLNGASIFLPAAGGRWRSRFWDDVGREGRYWSGTQHKITIDDEIPVYMLCFESDHVSDSCTSNPIAGYSVRPVSR